MEYAAIRDTVAAVLAQPGGAPVGLLCLLFRLSSALINGHEVAEHNRRGQKGLQCAIIIVIADPCMAIDCCDCSLCVTATAAK